MGLNPTHAKFEEKNALSFSWSLTRWWTMFHAHKCTFTLTLWKLTMKCSIQPYYRFRTCNILLYRLTEIPKITRNIYTLPYWPSSSCISEQLNDISVTYTCYQCVIKWCTCIINTSKFLIHERHIHFIQSLRYYGTSL